MSTSAVYEYRMIAKRHYPEDQLEDLNRLGQQGYRFAGTLGAHVVVERERRAPTCAECGHYQYHDLCPVCADGSGSAKDPRDYPFEPLRHEVRVVPDGT